MVQDRNKLRGLVFPLLLDQYKLELDQNHHDTMHDIALRRRGPKGHQL
jgi:hypothetical protein